MPLFKKKAPAYNAVFESPCEDVVIPPPTEEDIRWARALGGKISKDEFAKVSKTSNLWRLEYCIQNGKKLNSSNGYPLFWSIYLGTPTPEVVKLLIAHGADPSRNKSVPLRAAVKHKRKDIAFILFENNVDIDKAKGKPGSLISGLHLTTDDKVYLDSLYDEWKGLSLEDTIAIPSAQKEEVTPLMPSPPEFDASKYAIICSNPEIIIPLPTEQDVEWAKNLGDNPTREDLYKACKINNLWRAAHVAAKIDLSYNDQEPLRVINERYGDPKYLALLCAYGADAKKALALYRGTTNITVLRQFVDAQEDKNKRPLPNWQMQDDHSITYSSDISIDGDHRILRTTFNFQSQKIMSYIEAKATISAPSFERFDQQPTDANIRAAYQELQKAGGHPPEYSDVHKPKTSAPVKLKVAKQS